MTNEELAQGLWEAIQAEMDGHNFYMMAANMAQDEEGKKIFTKLAKEEMEHVVFLKKQHESLLKTGKPDPSVSLSKTAFTSTSPIFSDQIKSRLKQAHYEMSALSIGIQLELSAIDFYKSQAKKATEKNIQNFYQALAAWESTHYQMLLRQQDALKEDYWDKGDFVPF